MRFPFIEITITCASCNESSVIQVNIMPEQMACPICDTSLYVTNRVRGWIYVASNDSMPGLFKIGMTSRDAKERLKELSSSTGVPTPFILECLTLSNDPERDETLIHEKLAPHRVANKEFFEVKRGKLLRVIEDSCGRSPEYSRPIPEVTQPKREDGKLYCPKCNRLMRRLANKMGWFCKKCNVHTDSHGQVSI